MPAVCESVSWRKVATNVANFSYDFSLVSEIYIVVHGTDDHRYGLLIMPDELTGNRKTYVSGGLWSNSLGRWGSAIVSNNGVFGVAERSNGTASEGITCSVYVR